MDINLDGGKECEEKRERRKKICGNPSRTRGEEKTRKETKSTKLQAIED
jgi:hypothetical protein